MIPPPSAPRLDSENDWKSGWKTLGRRWLKFHFVGALGIGVQLTALGLLAAAGAGYLAATALAVEAAVVHNFVWHERMTWRDRATPGFDVRRLLGRFLRFQMANGLISLLGNLLLMRLLVGAFHLPVLAANLGAIAVCGVVNFVVSDRLVFTTSRAQRGSPMPGKCAGNG